MPDIPQEELDTFLKRVEERIRQAAANGHRWVWLNCRCMYDKSRGRIDSLDIPKSTARAVAVKAALQSAGFQVSDGFRDAVLDDLDVLVRW